MLDAEFLDGLELPVVNDATMLRFFFMKIDENRIKHAMCLE